jgi:hypothetical protein
MDILKKASGKRQIKMSKYEWEEIGKKAGWMKEAQPKTDENFSEHIGLLKEIESTINSLKEEGPHEAYNGNFAIEFAHDVLRKDPKIKEKILGERQKFIDALKTFMTDDRWMGMRNADNFLKNWYTI